jgi:adenylate cyclase
MWVKARVGPPMAKRDFQISIRTALSLGAGAMVLLTAALIQIPWSITSGSNVTSLNSRLNAEVIDGIGRRIDGLLDNAVATRDALARNFAQGVVGAEDGARRNMLMLSFLLTQPGLTAIELARPDNNSTAVRRGTDATIRVEETTAGQPTAQRELDVFRLASDGGLERMSHKRDATDYRPTEQFWYLTAFDRDRLVWSNIFRLRATGRLGVTTTRAIERDGRLLGVVGVTISLDQISGFLDRIEISPGSAVFLTNTYDELVAVQGAMVDAARANQPQSISKLEESSIPAVRRVVATLRDKPMTLNTLQSTAQFTFHDRQNGEDYFITLVPLSQMGLIACVVIPEADVFAMIHRNNRILLAALALFVLATVGLATVVSRRTIGAALARLTQNLRQLEDFKLDSIMAIPSHISELRQVSAATLRMSASLASFNKYIPTELVRSLFAQGIEAELGGERRVLTILFMDVADFTGISERLGDRIIDFLGDYLSEMSSQIQSQGGTIDKYIGDAIMAFWGAPVPAEQHALLACRGALACRARLTDLRDARRGSDLPAIYARIGLNSGEVLVGNVGSRDRLNYTAIGDAVNVASRLEALNKRFGTDIIIGESTYMAARDHLLVRPLGRIAVYGKAIGIEVYELLGLKDPADYRKPPWLALYDEGYAAMRRRDWESATARFQEVIAEQGRDQVSARMIERIEHFKKVPPSPDSDDLLVLDSK